MLRPILLTLATLLAGTNAMATSVSGSARAMAVYQFDSRAFGKTVASVMVHTGMGIEGRGYGFNHGITWTDVQDIPMVETKNGFFAKAILDGNYYGNSGGAYSIVGVFAQYWVTFSDGATLVTDPVLHPNNGLRSPSWIDQSGKLINGYRDALVQLIRAQTARQTQFEMFSHDGAEVQKADAELAGEIKGIRRGK